MQKSYEKINYGLRQAKCVERKMLCEIFRKLSEFRSLTAYRYIGFGSTYFSDFSLFHKALGITNMVTIEKDIENAERFRFNRPFKCIEFHFDTSNSVLPKLSWNVPTIIWLDYEDAIKTSVLTDIKFFCSSAVTTSLIVVTVNAHPGELGPPRLAVLKDRVGTDKVPFDIKEDDLAAWGTARVSRRIIANEIVETLNARNGGFPPGNKLRYKQLINFHYSDGAKMLTTGGLLYDESIESKVAACNFEALPFVRTDDRPSHIEIPNLTFREIHDLSSQLPSSDTRLLTTPVPQKDKEIYRDVYRYFPTFAETDV